MTSLTESNLESNMAIATLMRGTPIVGSNISPSSSDTIGTRRMNIGSSTVTITE